jgi:Fe-S-cluster-containing hydrogenase component 2
VKYSRKAVRDNRECVGCGKCVFICPYGAIKAEAVLHARHRPGEMHGLRGVPGRLSASAPSR